MSKILASLIIVIILIAGTYSYVDDHRKETVKSAPTSFNKTQKSLTDPSSTWVIVNKQHPLDPKNYQPQDLVIVGNGQKLTADAASALKAMLTDAKSKGIKITLESGFRSYDDQDKAYNSIVQGFSQAQADRESARPGYSEHQTGLAIDFGSGSCKVKDCFASTAAGKWLKANSYNYGYILRYTPTKTASTGYKSEPWHFRYVGKELASQLHANGKTMEEFFNTSGGATYR